MRDGEIDIELLISLVENQPVLWDKTTDEYKNKNLTAAAWREVCSILIQNFESLEDNDKSKICRSIQKKWANLRDAWVKHIKKVKDEKKSGSGTKLTKKYIYYEQMQFLVKVSDKHDTVSSLSEERKDTLASFSDDNSSQTSTSAVKSMDKGKTPTTTSRLTKKRKVDTVEERSLEELQRKPEENNRHMSFFKGILPSLQDFNEDQTIDFQMGVLNLIKNIRKSYVDTHFSTHF